MAITLKNAGRAPVTIQLPAELGTTQVRFNKVVTGAAGKEQIKRVGLSLPQSLTLLGGEVRTGIPDAAGPAAQAAGLVVIQQQAEGPTVVSKRQKRGK